MADLPLSSLTDDEKSLVNRLGRKARTEERDLLRLERYRDGEQRLRQLGIALPPELRDFETVINVPGMAVNEPVSRQELRAFVRTSVDEGGQRQELPDETLREFWEYNNLGSESTIAHSHARTFGRSFVSVSTNDAEDEPAIVTVESPLGFAVDIDQRKRRIASALRQWREDNGPLQATLYTASATCWLERGRNGWIVVERDDHKLGVVPLVMLVNRPWVNRWLGRSEMADVIPLTDSIARMITNMQVASETVAIPHRWAAGIDPKDFVDERGNPIPAWESYMTAMRATADPDAKFGTFTPGNLDNFNAAVNNMLAWCGMQLGLPTRYMGQSTVNPAAEGAIVADEIRLIRNVERMNRVDGDSWSWVMSLTEWFTTGVEPARNSIRAIWHNPATPTYSQRADAVVKLRSGPLPLVSRKGAWDEMGWSEERKTREEQYLAEEAADPLTAAFMEQVNAASDAAAF